MARRGALTVRISLKDRLVDDLELHIVIAAISAQHIFVERSCYAIALLRDLEVFPGDLSVSIHLRIWDDLLDIRAWNHLIVIRIM